MLRLDQKNTFLYEVLKQRRRAMGAANRKKTKTISPTRTRWLYPFQYERKYYTYIRSQILQFSALAKDELRNNLPRWVEESRIDEAIKTLQPIVDMAKALAIETGQLKKDVEEISVFNLNWGEIKDKIELGKEIKADVNNAIDRIDAFDEEWEQFTEDLRIKQEELYGEATGKGNTIGFLGDFGHDVNEFNLNQFQKFMKIAIGEAFIGDEPWVQTSIDNWSNNNFELIKSLSDDYIKQLNVIVTDGIQSGTLTKDIMKDFRKMDRNMTVSRARLLARDQVGKLNSTLTKNRQQGAGIDMYTWVTAGDERVRASHRAINGKLCRWDNNTVYSPDGGKTWKPRPASWPQSIPGMPVQCRCQAFPYFDDIIEGIDKEIDKEEGVQRKIEGKPPRKPKKAPPVEKPKTVTNQKDAEKAVKEVKLTNTEKKALDKYTSKGFEKINEDARAGKITKDMKDIDKALKKLPVYEGDANRGMGFFFPGQEDEYNAFIKKMKKGTNVKFPAYTSTSINKELADSVVSDFANARIFYKIKSKNGRYIGSLTAQEKNEFEVLFSRNTKFKITARDDDETPITKIHEITLEEI